MGEKSVFSAHLPESGYKGDAQGVIYYLFSQ